MWTAPGRGMQEDSLASVRVLGTTGLQALAFPWIWRRCQAEAPGFARNFGKLGSDLESFRVFRASLLLLATNDTESLMWPWPAINASTAKTGPTHFRILATFARCNATETRSHESVSYTHLTLPTSG